MLRFPSFPVFPRLTWMRLQLCSQNPNSNRNNRREQLRPGAIVGSANQCPQRWRMCVADFESASQPQKHSQMLCSMGMYLLLPLEQMKMSCLIIFPELMLRFDFLRTSSLYLYTTDDWVQEIVSSFHPVWCWEWGCHIPTLTEFTGDLLMASKINELIYFHSLWWNCSCKDYGYMPRL